MLMKQLTGGTVGGMALPDLTNMQEYTQTAQQFPATVGKKYLVMYSVSSSGSPQVSSGATLESSYVYTNVYSAKVWLGIVTATASTVVMNGTGNNVNYLQLD